VDHEALDSVLRESWFKQPPEGWDKQLRMYDLVYGTKIPDRQPVNDEDGRES
jgi:hypothetical protein